VSIWGFLWQSVIVKRSGATPKIFADSSRSRVIPIDGMNCGSQRYGNWLGRDDLAQHFDSQRAGYPGRTATNIRLRRENKTGIWLRKGRHSSEPEGLVEKMGG